MRGAALMYHCCFPVRIQCQPQSELNEAGSCVWKGRPPFPAEQLGRRQVQRRRWRDRIKCCNAAMPSLRCMGILQGGNPLSRGIHPLPGFSTVYKLPSPRVAPVAQIFLPNYRFMLLTAYMLLHAALSTQRG